MFPDAFQTARLILRPIRPSDAAPIFDTYAQDPDVTRYLTWRAHQTLADTEAYVSRCLTAPSHLFRTYALVGRQDDEVLGAFGIRQPEAYRLGYAYVLARKWWGQGLMTEALTEVASWALNRGDIWRIGDFCDVDNLASARVMEKAGMTREGLLRRWSMHQNVSDEPRDCFSFAKIR
ncbi:MAG: N-acetyltransferase [Alphaproteobacteria bacterium]|nr:N-acetyltransferase [Alphaproteobacteria bacterium]